MVNKQQNTKKNNFLLIMWQHKNSEAPTCHDPEPLLSTSYRRTQPRKIHFNIILKVSYLMSDPTQILLAYLNKVS
jgi:hypothetical protein